MSEITSESEAAVRALMESYVEAIYQADVDTLRRLFHPDAFMGGYLGDQLLMGSPAPFVDDVASQPAMAASNTPFKGEISNVEVTGRAATATLRETGFFGEGRFVNYFGLLQDAEGWKIISKTFASL